LEDALTILSQPRERASRAAAAGPIKEFGQLEGAAGPVKVLAGRFGPYVTDGEVNATLPKTIDPEAVTEEMALELLAKKREAGPSPKFKRRSTGRAKAKSKR